MESRRYYGIEKQQKGKGVRAELLEQLKQEEKVQRQEEYEQCVAQAINEMSRLAVEKEWENQRENMEKIMDTVQNMAFMEGYHYAIAILEESLRR